jgi:hypothetical protein
MNVVLINLETNMGLNVSIHPHYGWMIFFLHQCMDEKNKLNLVHVFNK